MDVFHGTFQFDNEKDLLSDILFLFTLPLPTSQWMGGRPSVSALSLKTFQAAFICEATILQLQLESPSLHEIISPLLNFFEGIISDQVLGSLDFVADNENSISSLYPRLCRLQQYIRVEQIQEDEPLDLHQYILFNIAKEERGELLDALEEFNRQMVSHLSTKSFASQDTVPARVLPHFIRDRLLVLHKALKAHVSCKCGSQHSVTLRLATHEHLKCDDDEETCLEISFLDESNGLSRWAEAKISVKDHHQSARLVAFAEDLESSQSPGKPKPPANNTVVICPMIKTALKHRSPFHLLLSKEIFERRPNYPPVYDHYMRPRQPLGVHKVFDRQRQMLNGEDVLTSKGRLVLAVILANGLLPFLGTPWLARRWDHRSIVFFYQSRDSRNPNVTRPFLVADGEFLVKGTGESEEDPGAPDYSYCFHPIPDLLSLGVLLCELVVGRPIEDLLSVEHIIDGQPDINEVCSRAIAISATMGDPLFERYRAATKACLTWSFIPTEHAYNPDFDSPDLRQRIYDNVVKPLEEELYIAHKLTVDQLEDVAHFDWGQCWEPVKKDEPAIPEKPLSWALKQTQVPRILRKHPWPPSQRQGHLREHHLSQNHPQLPPQAQRHFQEQVPPRNHPQPPSQQCDLKQVGAVGFPDLPQIPNPLPPGGLLNLDLEFLLFDTPSTDGSKFRDSDMWIELLTRCYEKHALEVDPNIKRVKVAILDTGYDGEDPMIADHKHRIKESISWASDGCATVDIVGHGTHALGLLLETAPHADIYVAQLSNSKILLKKDYVRIVKAIRYAVDIWDVDIVSMSFGLRASLDKVRTAIKRASDNGKIMFAAASNSGGNVGRAYPASDRNVICVHSTDGSGNKSDFSPSFHEDTLNFSILGEEVLSSWPPGVDGCAESVRRSSGTSVATPIAAGVAATVLGFARSFEGKNEHPKRHQRLMQHLRSSPAMIDVLKMMVERKRDGYDYITPWHLFESKRSRSQVYEDMCHTLERTFGAEESDEEDVESEEDF